MSKKKIRINGNNPSVSEVFSFFITSQAAKGVSDKTLANYQSHFKSFSQHLDSSVPMSSLKIETIEQMVVSMRKSGLAHNSISSYLRVFRTFINWCRRRGYSHLTMPNYKDEETVQDTYTDEELRRLLVKPKREAGFCEYRNWVIINFLLNCGCRSGTLREIRTSDVDLESRQVVYRHTKNRHLQNMPLCSLMIAILKEYMVIRGGAPSDFLFCDIYGNQLSESALKTAIHRYNKKRGVEKTSVHAFRHTFSRKFLIDCHGDAFTLQRLLGHTTLTMTKHYCNIYDSDIVGQFDTLSPLNQIAKSTTIIRRT